MFEPLPELKVIPSISFELMRENIQYSSSLGIKKITDNPAWRVDNRIAIVGGGPSLKDNLDELRKYKYIMACGSVHDYLVRNSIYPTWCVVCDPDEIMIEYLKEKNLVTEYLIASQCHAKVFEHLKYNKTYLWHAASGLDEENERVNFPKEDFLIGGGCTVGTRAIVIAMMFGFNNQALFGFDSCYSRDDKHHAYDFVDPSRENSSINDVQEIKIDAPNSPTFKVAGYMLAQVRDWQLICQIYKEQINFTIYGDGLLKFIADEAVRKYNEGIRV